MVSYGFLKAGHLLISKEQGQKDPEGSIIAVSVAT